MISKRIFSSLLFATTLFFTLLSTPLVAGYANAFAHDFVREGRYPGGVALIPLAKVATNRNKPAAFYNGKKVALYKQAEQWIALIGIPLNAEVGSAKVEFYPTGDESGQPQTIEFEIFSKEYEAQYITLPTQRHVNLSDKNLKRHQTERASSLEALAVWSETLSPFSNAMIWPVTGRISAIFGLRRFFNEQPRQPHSGIDIAAPKGTPILAPIDGIVVETGDYFFNGNTVFLDHGYGIVSMFCHLDKTSVAVGDHVAQGDKLGTVGATGRVTGPHLHWSVSVNRNMVDPALFVPPMPQTQTTPANNPGAK